MQTKGEAAAAGLTPNASRKRKQNRISQQCLREKKSAAGPPGFFDRLQGDIAALRDACEGSGQVDAARLLDMQHQLVDENRNLRDALLRMRKKLLSLSSAADSAADDPIFQKLLSKEQPDAAGAENNTASKRQRRCSDGSDARLSDGCSPYEQLHNGQHHHARVDALGVGAHPTCSPPDDAFADLHQAAPAAYHQYSTDPVHNIAATAADDAARCLSSIADVPGMRFAGTDIFDDDKSLVAQLTGLVDKPPTAATMATAAAGDLGDFSAAAAATTTASATANAMAGAGADPTTTFVAPDLLACCTVPILSAPQISMSNQAMLDAWMSRSYANTLAQRIEGACIRYAIAARRGERDAGGPLSKLGLSSLSQKGLIDRLSDVAVSLIFDDVGLGPFVDALEGAREFLKAVLSCRILLGCAKPAVPDATESDDSTSESDVDSINVQQHISPPSADFPLTWSTSTRPVIVDMIAWPSLRDQMVFHSCFYDLDEMTEDIINNTVADFPEHAVALGVYDCSPPARQPDPPTHGFKHPVDACDMPGGVRQFKFLQQEQVLRFVEAQDLLPMVTSRMDGYEGWEAECGGGGAGAGAQRFKGWRLSDSFFKKYPFLQCSSLASPYPVVQPSKIQAR